MKSGFVAIIGKPNVGKSTLLNRLAGQKIAIVSSKPQTTRTAIKGIINLENAQIIFTDTPGIHKPKSKLGNTMNDTAWDTIADNDIVLFVVEATSSGIGKGDQMNRQRFCIDAGALSVKERRFHCTADLRYRHSVIHVPTPSS